MCKIITIIRSSGKDDKELRILFSAQLEKLKEEPDGIGAMAVKPDGTVETRRELKKGKYADVFYWALEQITESRLIVLHTRTGTSGNRELNNVHLWNRDGLYFAHNGMVEAKKDFQPFYSTQAGFRTQKDSRMDEWERLTEIMEECAECQANAEGLACKRHKSVMNRMNKLEAQSLITDWDEQEEKQAVKKQCDSLEFLESIKRPILAQELEELAEKRGFWGYGVLYDEKTGYLYQLVEKTVYAITGEEKGYVFLTSYEPETSYKDYITETVEGLTLYREKAEEMDIPDDRIFNLTWHTEGIKLTDGVKAGIAKKQPVKSRK
ncbi:MAG: hypothetical protein KGJ90_06460 [Patescibacteria group bacterium]|nr:hypothetical protein [Patescibacteria group bacterium]